MQPGWHTHTNQPSWCVWPCAQVTNLATVTPENSLQGPVTTTAAIQLVLSGCLLTPVQLQLTNLKTWAVGQVAWTLTASGSPANLIVDKQSSSGGGGSAQITLTAQPSVVGTATAWLSGTLQVCGCVGCGWERREGPAGWRVSTLLAHSVSYNCNSSGPSPMSTSPVVVTIAPC